MQLPKRSEKNSNNDNNNNCCYSSTAQHKWTNLMGKWIPVINWNLSISLTHRRHFIILKFHWPQFVETLNMFNSHNFGDSYRCGGMLKYLKSSIGRWYWNDVLPTNLLNNQDSIVLFYLIPLFVLLFCFSRFVGGVSGEIFNLNIYMRDAYGIWWTIISILERVQAVGMCACVCGLIAFNV